MLSWMKRRHVTDPQDKRIKRSIQWWLNAEWMGFQWINNTNYWYRKVLVVRSMFSKYSWISNLKHPIWKQAKINVSTLNALSLHLLIFIICWAHSISQLVDFNWCFLLLLHPINECALSFLFNFRQTPIAIIIYYNEWKWTMELDQALVPLSKHIYFSYSHAMAIRNW